MRVCYDPKRIPPFRSLQTFTEGAHTRSVNTIEVDEIALESTWEANGPSSHRARPRRPGVRLPSSSQAAYNRGCQGEVAFPWRNSQRGSSIGPAPKTPNNWASIRPIVAHPFGGVRDDNDPLPNFASTPGDFVACCQSGPRRRELQHHSSGWSEGAWRHKHQRTMLQLLLLQ